MKTFSALALGIAAVVAVTLFAGDRNESAAAGEKSKTSPAPDKAAVERTRETTQMLDNIYKQTVVLITDKYVHDEDDFAAGSAAVLLFSNISKTGSHKVRLLDATGSPYNPKNVAKDDFERDGIKRLKAGDATYEQIVTEDGKPYLRTVTAVPVVMKKCVMCHEHYGDAKKGEAIGAISYTVPIK